MKHGKLLEAIVGAGLVLALAPAWAHAHCDTLDGPVVKDARAALEAGDPSRVLRWVAAEKEAEIREAFAQARAVRALGPEAQALADRFFFETLVRVHRAGEGEPYTGLKPAGVEIEPAVAASDAALATGSADALARMVTAAADRGIRERFARAAEAKKHADETVARGREFVAAYVEFMHYAERLHGDAITSPAHEGHAAAAEPEPHRH
jgi:hypothetical protein